MTVIDITEFGGIAPSVDPRELGPGRAQTASNLDLRYGDFRPIKGPGASVTTVTTGTKSLHRTPSGVWLSSTAEADFVNGQLNDTTTERVYVTGHAAYPEAWSGGSYRRLGVRAPTAAPTATVVVVDEYTLTEQQASIQTWAQDIRDAVIANHTSPLLANGTPTTGSLGAVWLTHGDVTPMPTSNSAQIVYATPLTSGAATNASDQYLLDPLLGGSAITYASNSYWAVPITWRPVGYIINESALATEIKTFTNPVTGGQLMPDATADQLAARVANIANVALEPLATLIARVNAAQNEVSTYVTRVLTDTARIYALSDALQRLAATIRAVDNYFAGANTLLENILNDYAYVVPLAVDRVVETRTYFYTYVTDWGEESAPSPTSTLVELDQNDHVDITVVAPPASSTYGATTLWRLYRSSTTNEGAAFEFVAETAIGTLTYTDSKLQEELGPDVCQTLTWTEPRSDMVNLCGGANGIMAGSVGKIACFCVAYTPYAWPREYELALQHTIIAIKAVAQGFILLTEGDPVLVSGADPAQMSDQKLDRPQSVVSKRSAASAAGAALFASPDGVCIVDPTGVSVLTLAGYSKDDWAALTPSASFAAFSEGVYYLWLTTAGKLLTMDFATKGMTLTTASGATAAYTDLLTDTLYTAVSTTVLPMLSGSAQSGVWKSGVYTFNDQPSFAWARVNGNFTSGTLVVYADGNTAQTSTVSANTPIRLAATRGREWSLQWTDDERATRITLASSSEELRRGG